MIDTNELRKLTQAATSGEWYVKRGNYIYGRNEVTDGEEVWYPVIACTDDDEVNVNFEANAAFIAAANPAAISELLDRLEAAENDVALKERVIDALGSELNAVANERDDLLARIREMERQEPVAKVRVHRTGGNAGLAWSVAPLNDFDSLPLMRDGDRLYALPGAQGVQ